jgi:uncharacterized GH25 family protein
MFGFIGVACLLLTEANATLSGKIVDEKSQPVAGAIVVISTARPRKGPATTCPSCYRECTKRTRTDAKGEFKFDSLSSSLTFSLAAGASGYQGTISDYFDPLAMTDVRIALREITKSDETRWIQGKVVNETGQPISGAMVSSKLIDEMDGRVTGDDPSVTPLTLTDGEGAFQISVRDTISSVTLRVSTAGYAPAEIAWLRSKPEAPMFQLGRGASVRGQLLFDGKPLREALVGIVQVNRTIGYLVTPLEISTDPNGVFQFDQLPADMDYALYTHNNQIIPGVQPVSLVMAPGNGKLADLGEIITQEARTLRITVLTEDGTSIPENSVVWVSRRRAWHTPKMSLPTDVSTATVKFSGVANELHEISVRVPGYRVSHTIPKRSADLNEHYPIYVKGDTELTLVVTKRIVR